MATILNNVGLKDLNQITFPLVIYVYMCVFPLCPCQHQYFSIKSWQFDRLKSLICVILYYCYFVVRFSTSGDYFFQWITCLHILSSSLYLFLFFVLILVIFVSQIIFPS